MNQFERVEGFPRLVYEPETIEGLEAKGILVRRGLWYEVPGGGVIVRDLPWEVAQHLHKLKEVFEFKPEKTYRVYVQFLVDGVRLPIEREKLN